MYDIFSNLPQNINLQPAGLEILQNCLSMCAYMCHVLFMKIIEKLFDGFYSYLVDILRRILK